LTPAPVKGKKIAKKEWFFCTWFARFRAPTPTGRQKSSMHKKKFTVFGVICSQIGLYILVWMACSSVSYYGEVSSFFDKEIGKFLFYYCKFGLSFAIFLVSFCQIFDIKEMKDKKKKKRKKRWLPLWLHQKREKEKEKTLPASQFPFSFCGAFFVFVCACVCFFMSPLKCPEIICPSAHLPVPLSVLQPRQITSTKLRQNRNAVRKLRWK
jgi:hypothetical protein